MNNMNTSFILRRMHRFSTLPPSLKVMRVITIVGIALAVTTLLISMTIARGFEHAYMRSLLDFNAHVIVLPSFHSTEVQKDIVQKLSHLKEKGEILSFTHFLYREALAVSHGTIKGVVVKGVDPDQFTSLKTLNVHFWQDDHKKNKPVVVIGKALTKMLEVTPQDPGLRLLLPTKETNRFEEIEAIGTFSSGMYDYDSQFLFMSIPEMKSLFEIQNDEMTGIEISLADPNQAFSLAEKLRVEFQDIDEILTWKDLNRDLFAALTLEKWMFGMIMGVIVIVAALNIMTVLILLILFRKKEVAILYALGMPRKKLVGMITRSGVWTGMIGVIIGLAVSGLIIWVLKSYPLIALEEEIYFLRHLPLDFSPVLCGFIGTFCLGICAVTSRLAAARLSSYPLGDGLR
ncbi:MAG: hypothetical protein A3I05_04665 [Deltaproteobacteria bacterium RIFCSPLOWO2_02_FULL_44_10]|nr:MAG: hypothetical protein A3I05_04665 [Deltaproteobacteria bacterium RIFCSPLOWO2_02_FULL_44_10]